MTTSSWQRGSWLQSVLNNDQYQPLCFRCNYRATALVILWRYRATALAVLIDEKRPLSFVLDGGSQPLAEIHSI